ncbi:hypothetical protein LY625_05210 [Lysobacter sp. GX 14042]|uniref:hypothetical protein n=1 Tax=Lysobacter sp. GX 14042 TaxID=2907155 RepID=UPI001F41D5A7|nr:hypothetical protein [Lysobacter sp. GX 14042]MCE7032020.1 hypothetical protein [Lysobacter sp. GX 14042]
MLATRLIAPVLAVVLGALAVSTPAPARASDDLIRVLVDVADVVMRGDQAYYRHGRYGHNDRLVVVRDHHGRASYYRHVPRQYRRGGPPHGVAHGYYRNAPGRANCNSNGKCKVTYYDPRKDRKRNHNSRNSRGW